MSKHKGVASGVYHDVYGTVAEFGFGNTKIMVMAGSIDELLFGFKKLTGHPCDQSMIKRLAVFEKSAVNDVKGGAA